LHNIAAMLLLLCGCSQQVCEYMFT